MKIDITVKKYEEVGGKKRLTKVFKFAADPQQYARIKGEKSLVRELEAYVAKCGVFTKAELPVLVYDTKEFLKAWKELHAQKKDSVNDFLSSGRVAAEMIHSLRENEVFVFGSNDLGQHLGGAAYTAVLKFGAVMGQAFGMQGKSFAIPSMSGLSALGENVARFADYARSHPEMRFLVTPIGCGIAKLSPQQVAPLFRCCVGLQNVALPLKFWTMLGVHDMDDLKRIQAVQE